MTLEELPPVLVLHLKRFVFEKTGGCQKLVKNIDYPVDLEISKGAYFIFFIFIYYVYMCIYMYMCVLELCKSKLFTKHVIG